MQEIVETRWYGCLSEKSQESMGLSLPVRQLLYQALTVPHEALTRLLHTCFISYSAVAVSGTFPYKMQVLTILLKKTLTISHTNC